MPPRGARLVRHLCERLRGGGPRGGVVLPRQRHHRPAAERRRRRQKGAARGGGHQREGAVAGVLEPKLQPRVARRHLRAERGR
eukprot:564509-Pyramimonas_sp.AAC.2